MKHLIIKNVYIITFLIFIVSVNSKTTSPQLNRNAYVAASVLKTLGSKQDFDKLTSKFLRYCPNMKITKEMKSTIAKINFLTSKKPFIIGLNFAKHALKKVFKKPANRLKKLNRKVSLL